MDPATRSHEPPISGRLKCRRMDILAAGTATFLAREREKPDCQSLHRPWGHHRIDGKVVAHLRMPCCIRRHRLAPMTEATWPSGHWVVESKENGPAAYLAEVPSVSSRSSRRRGLWCRWSCRDAPHDDDAGCERGRGKEMGGSVHDRLTVRNCVAAATRFAFLAVAIVKARYDEMFGHKCQWERGNVANRQVISSNYHVGIEGN